MVNAISDFMHKKAPRRELNHVAEELFFFKHVLAYATKWTDPIIREVFESCSRGDSVVGISDCRVILITACTADVLIQTQISFVELEFKAKT